MIGSGTSNPANILTREAVVDEENVFDLMVTEGTWGEVPREGQLDGEFGMLERQGPSRHPGGR
jgi:hypothetical protein